MKRDPELLRQILIIMENGERGHAVINSLKSMGYDGNAALYHCYLLDDAGLIKAANITSRSSPHNLAIPISMRSAGHDFLELSQNDNIWSVAMGKFKTIGGGLTVTLMSEVLMSVARTQLGI